MNANILTQRSKLMVIGMKNRKNYSYDDEVDQKLETKWVHCCLEFI